jgi:hypothetical protein
MRRLAADWAKKLNSSQRVSQQKMLHYYRTHALCISEDCMNHLEHTQGGGMVLQNIISLLKKTTVA